MNNLIFQLHTPEELVLYSNIAHWIEGGLFLIVAGIALAQAFGYFKSQKALFIWPSIILFAGLFLPLFAFTHHLNGELALAWQASIQDQQQRQHLIMAIVIGFAGLAEVWYLRNQSKQKILQFVFPAALSIIGILFLIHPQHGTSEAMLKAVLIHRYLGTTLILAGIFRALDVWKNQANKIIAIAWVLFLSIAAILLISYREPEGAYKMELNNSSHIEHHR